MRTGFIGTGNMGGAILRSYAASARGKKDRIMIFDRDEKRCEQLIGMLPGVSMTGSVSDLVAASDTVVLGVKPQGMEEVLKEVAKTFRSSHLVISMAAGISVEYIRGFLGQDARVIRIMPNTPALVGEGMIAVCRDDRVDDEALDAALSILEPSGKCQVVAESMIDCVIGVSGSSPAYTFMYIEALVRAAGANGMEEDQARIFAAQAVLGAAKLVMESEESLQQLRINVCSPGGTTIEAVNRLLENGFMKDVEEGFQAAVDRSIEMTREKG